MKKIVLICSLFFVVCIAHANSLKPELKQSIVNVENDCETSVTVTEVINAGNGTTYTLTVTLTGACADRFMLIQEAHAIIDNVN